MRLKMSFCRLLSQLPTSSTEWGIVKKGILFQSLFQILPLFDCAGAVPSQSYKFQGESGQLRLISFISSLFCGGNILCVCIEVSGFIMGNVVTPLNYVMGSAARSLGFQHTVKHHRSSWEESKHMRFCEAVALPPHGVGTPTQGALCLSSELLT